MDPINPPKNNLILLAATFIFLAAGLIALTIGFLSSGSDDQRGGQIRSQLKPERGSTTLVRASTRVIVTKDLPIFVGDLIATDDIGRAWIDFGPTQGSLALLEETEVELVPLNLGVMVRILKGTIEVLAAPDRSRVVIQYPNSEIKKLADVPFEETQLDESYPVGSADQEVTQEFLESNMLRLRPQVLRCYSQYIVSSRALQERIEIVATISYVGGRGGVQNVSLSSAKTLDQSLKKCIEETLKTLSLSPYKGPLIDIQLPIILE